MVEGVCVYCVCPFWKLFIVQRTMYLLLHTMTWATHTLTQTRIKYGGAKYEILIIFEYEALFMLYPIRK